MRKKLKEIVFDVIQQSDYITKAEIKDKVLDIAVENKILTKEFVVAFGDIGWIFQELRQMDKIIEVEKVGNKYFWFVV